MFCPKCGTQSIDKDQRFCKSCGTNLQAVSDAIEKGDTKPDISKDPVAYGLHFVHNIVDSVKESVGDVNINKGQRQPSHIADKIARREAKREEWKAHHRTYLEKREERRRQKEKRKHIPDGNVLLTYSSEHNLRYGLLSFFGGLAFAAFLYFFCRDALNNGAMQDIEELTHRHINALEPFIRWLWLLPGITALKGLGQILYAAFFAESIKTLSERYKEQVEDEERYTRNTAPRANTAPIPESLPEPPPSVTEGTTHLFEKAKATERG